MEIKNDEGAKRKKDAEEKIFFKLCLVVTALQDTAGDLIGN